MKIHFSSNHAWVFHPLLASESFVIYVGCFRGPTSFSLHYSRCGVGLLPSFHSPVFRFFPFQNKYGYESDLSVNLMHNLKRSVGTGMKVEKSKVFSLNATRRFRQSRCKHDVSSPSQGKARHVPQHGTYPMGFKTGGFHCGVKKHGGLDLALLRSTEKECNAAAVFTRNLFQAAPVQVSKETLEVSKGIGVSGLVVNSGCANAITGQGGLRDAQAMRDCFDKASSVQRAGGSSLVMSTGVIGQRLPIDSILRGIQHDQKKLDSSHSHWLDCAKAICTTDTFPKLVSREFGVSGKTYRIAGMAKGAGMIHPNMATLLGFMATDAPVSPTALQKALVDSMEGSFHSISIDGDSSTNDTVALLANGAAGGKLIEELSEDYVKVQEAVAATAEDLAKLVVRDGEGATKFISIVVQDARSYVDAKKVASTIATSTLVKTALFGQDANWGRILCATGYAGVALDPTRTSVSFVPTDGSPELRVLLNGEPESVDEARAAEILAMEDLELVVNLGTNGGFAATYWTCDLSHEVSLRETFRG